MRTGLYWVDSPWPGKLALAARPRGGEWLPDEIASWKRAGVASILSLLTPEEARDLGLSKEASESRKHGLLFQSLPIPDREVPESEAKLNEVLTEAVTTLKAGKNLLIHCRQGIGRTGLVAACLLVRGGMTPSAAVDTISAVRGMAVPETREQRDWIERHAPAMVK
ncbi:MAG: protein-tyrosine phosphatase family protein [Candidatus Sulfotelmatobacter sp.]